MTTLSRTTGTPTLGTKFTCSCWYKFSEVPATNGGSSGSDRWLFGEYSDSNNHSYLYLRNSSAVGWFEKNGGSVVISKITNRFFQDMNAWYHIVLAVDTTESASEDRVKLYVNGDRVTSWGTNTGGYSSSATVRLGAASRTFFIGKATGYSSGQAYDGYMSHFHFSDGSALAASDFGSTDSNSGAWKIKTAPTFTPGNNGFTIMQDGKTITDQSANSNDFTLAEGTLSKSEDNPSNSFCTLNPNIPSGGGYQGNSSSWDHAATEFTTNNSSSNYGTSFGTMQAYKGKWYYEVLYTSSSNQATIGISGSTCRRNGVNDYLGDKTYDYGYSATDGKAYSNGNSNYATGLGTYSGGDYIGVFYDLDNNKLYFSKNGVMANTTGITIAAYTSTEDFGYVPAVCEYNSGGNGTFACNFGNGSFAGTQLTGTTYAGADGLGIFKYDPTSITLDGVSKSFNALSTKGLNE